MCDIFHLIFSVNFLGFEKEFNSLPFFYRKVINLLVLYTIRLSSTRSENVCVYVCARAPVCVCVYVCVCMYVCGPFTLNLSAQFSRRWLNRFRWTWARLKATTWPQIKCKLNMATTSGSGDITEPMTEYPLHYSRLLCMDILLAKKVII